MNSEKLQFIEQQLVRIQREILWLKRKRRNVAVKLKRRVGNAVAIAPKKNSLSRGKDINHFPTHLIGKVIRKWYDSLTYSPKRNSDIL